MRLLAEATWTDLDAAERRLLVIPLGSTEQHGPHLPLDTDTRIITAVVTRACAGRPGVHVAPAFAYGASHEHADFAGTVSIGTEALRDALVALGRMTASHWPAVLFANGHGGNVEAIEQATATLAAEGMTCEAWHAQLPGGDAHAGRSETSLMLALAADLVHLDRAIAGDTTPIDELLPALREHGVRTTSPSGVLGDPTGATAAEGERLLGVLVGSLGAILEQRSNT